MQHTSCCLKDSKTSIKNRTTDSLPKMKEGYVTWPCPAIAGLSVSDKVSRGSTRIMGQAGWSTLESRIKVKDKMSPFWKWLLCVFLSVHKMFSVAFSVWGYFSSFLRLSVVVCRIVVSSTDHARPYRSRKCLLRASTVCHRGGNDMWCLTYGLLVRAYITFPYATPPTVPLVIIILHIINMKCLTWFCSFVSGVSFLVNIWMWK